MDSKTYSLGDELGCAARHSAFLDDNGTLAGVLSDNGSNGLKGSHISGATSTDTSLFGGRVD